LLAIASATNADPYAVWLRISLENALIRNARRKEDVRVPDDSIVAVASQFEPPAASEGFRDVLIVEQD
jgi:hypothetical protein